MPTAIAFSLFAFGFAILPSQYHPHLSVDSKVGVNNIGAIRIGMTKEEAEAVSGVKLFQPIEKEPTVLTEYCYWIYPEGLQGVPIRESDILDDESKCHCQCIY